MDKFQNVYNTLDIFLHNLINAPDSASVISIYERILPPQRSAEMKTIRMFKNTVTSHGVFFQGERPKATRGQIAFLENEIRYVQNNTQEVKRKMLAIYRKKQQSSTQQSANNENPKINKDGSQTNAKTSQATKKTAKTNKNSSQINNKTPKPNILQKLLNTTKLNNLNDAQLSFLTRYIKIQLCKEYTYDDLKNMVKKDCKVPEEILNESTYIELAKQYAKYQLSLLSETQLDQIAKQVEKEHSQNYATYNLIGKQHQKIIEKFKQLFITKFISLAQAKKDEKFSGSIKRIGDFVYSTNLCVIPQNTVVISNEQTSQYYKQVFSCTILKNKSCLIEDKKEILLEYLTSVFDAFQKAFKPLRLSENLKKYNYKFHSLLKEFLTAKSEVLLKEFLMQIIELLCKYVRCIYDYLFVCRTDAPQIYEKYFILLKREKK